VNFDFGNDAQTIDDGKHADRVANNVAAVAETAESVCHRYLVFTGVPMVL
jgi:hypothetical protein